MGVRVVGQPPPKKHRLVTAHKPLRRAAGGLAGCAPVTPVARSLCCTMMALCSVVLTRQ